jgi:hypothetical protein
MSKNLKIAAAISVVVAALGALLLVPALQKAPEPGLDLRTPSMNNIPDPGSGALKLDVDTSRSEAEPEAR